MNSEYAKVICDSISPAGRRLISIECKYWRNIHSELMTHRIFARNSASSRAIPVAKTFEIVEKDPFIPEFIGKEQSGMQAGTQLNGYDETMAKIYIMEMRDFCLDRCKKLAELKVHKSIINRYLESWSYITVLITATDWSNFFALRLDGAAEKHFQKVARLMRRAMDESVPKLVGLDEWHMPYIRPEDVVQLSGGYDIPWMDLVKVSVGKCARLSYLTHDGQRDMLKDIELCDRLMDNNPKHSSPGEHVARPLEDPNQRIGCFLGWQSYRHTLVGESVREPVLPAKQWSYES